MSKNHCGPDNLPEQVPHPESTRFVDRTGQRFGRLTVLYYLGRLGGGEHKNSTWLCLCDCGTYTSVAGCRLTSGQTTSCGCWARAASAARLQTHGMASAPEYGTWVNMIARCLRPADPYFRNYGGRGITVCERWQSSVKAFIEDMGPRPTPKHTIDRIDNDGNYEPSNCRWVTRKRQMRNMRRNLRITYNGQTRCVAEWAEEVGLSRATLYSRLRLGWSHARALCTPVCK